MATAPRPAVPAPQIFTSDPIEQTYAKGTLDPAMGGIAYAYLQAAKGDRQDSQDVYMQSLKSAQDLQAQLQREDNAQELLSTALKQGPDYAKAGISPSEVPLINNLYRGGSGTSNSAGLYRSLIAAEAQQKLAAAAHAGDAGAPVETVQRTVGANGEIGDTVLTSKGKAGGGLGAVMKSADEQAAREKTFRGQGTGPPTAGGAGVRPSIGQARGTGLQQGQQTHPGSNISPVLTR